MTSHQSPARPFDRALVVGLGKSGRAAARLLGALGVEVFAYDRGHTSTSPGVAKRFEGQDIPDAAFVGVDAVVLSPGVPPGGVRTAASRHAPDAQIVGELGLSLALVHDPSVTVWPAIPTALITGTNGKSTVTAMLGALLGAAGRSPFVGGNLGEPLATRLADVLEGTASWPDTLVLECSSFQLETLTAVPTDVAMLLNISPDHLDRYASLEDYAHTKARVFAGLRADGLALLARDDPWTPRLRPAGGRVRLVADFAGGDTIVLDDGERIAREDLRLPGGHNATNATFAALAARHLGAPLPACIDGLRRFEGLPHRMQLVRELDDVRYYNDSKATNAASAVATLRGLPGRFVLIAGGRAKGDDLDALRQVIGERAAGLIAIGEAAPTFAALGRGVVPTQTASEIGEAVAAARALAQPGQSVVLAPACASFDQFANYAERGEAFAAAVRAL